MLMLKKHFSSVQSIQDAMALVIQEWQDMLAKAAPDQEIAEVRFHFAKLRNDN